MTFDEILAQVRDLVQSKGRVAYRALKRRFEIDDEYLEDLKAELIDAEQVACDEDGKVLVWAGKERVQRSANVEAISHLTKGLELLKTLPDTPERAQQELTLQITLGAPLITTKGFAAPEVEKTYNRAQELCRQMGETPSNLFGTKRIDGISLAYRGELQTAYKLGKQLLRLAQKEKSKTRPTSWRLTICQEWLCSLLEN